MATLNEPVRHRGRHARPLLVAATLVAALAVAFLPAGPARVVALTSDPSATPAVDPAPTPAPDPTPAPEPTATPAPDSTPAPGPSATLDPTTSPAPRALPSPDPGASADPSAPPSPDPTPSADPSAAPDPSASPEQSNLPDPSATPGPSLTPDPAGSSPPEPSPSADPSASPEPSPSPTPLPPGTLGADGGTIGGAGAWLDVAPGGLAAPTTISLRAAGSAIPDFDGAPPLAGYALLAIDADSGGPLAGLGAATLRVSVDSITLGDSDVADLRIARFDGAWSVLVTTVVDGSLRAPIPSPGLYAVVEIVTASAADGQVALTTDAPEAGLHRVEPGGLLAVQVDGRALRKLRDARLAASIPPGWEVVDADGGAFDGPAREIAWSSRTVRGGTETLHRIVLRAPIVDPDAGGPAFSASFQARYGHRGGQSVTAPVVILVAPPVVVAHVTLGDTDATTLAPVYLPEDAAILAEQRYATFRIRFQVRNADSIPVDWAPQLDVRAAGDGSFSSVPSLQRGDGEPFYVTREWQRNPVGGGTRLGTEQETLAADQLRSDDTDGPDQVPAAGTHSMGPNPLPAFTLGPRSYTEIEFSVRATVDAVYQGLYEFRVTDAGRDFTGARTAWVHMGPRPAVQLSPGQRTGIPVAGSPPDDTGSLTVASPALVEPAAVGVIRETPATAGVTYALDIDTVAEPAVTASDPSPRYALVPPRAPDGTFITPHAADTLTSDTCAACHRAHVAQGSSLTTSANPQATLCLSCHDGTGAATDVAAQYTDASVPANDASTASYYRHDALAPSTHTNAGENEFQDTSGQAILNRHAECSDCHQPHRATSGGSTQTVSGWTLTGRETGISGVSVRNGVAGAPPTYTYLDGSATAPVTDEYQLCFKCHAGFTTLPASDPAAPSRWSIDKGIELNPANTSYHPVEAPGRNVTGGMAGSLAGTSPYKLWAFTTGSTVRCVNCHADPQALAAGTVPAAGDDLAPHAGPNRGLLLANYQDRGLEPADAPYDATDFALCYLCHAEAPFRDASGEWRTDTNFRFHGLHVSLLAGKGPGGTSIDTPGDGGGNAICAECHFRVHSTASRNDFRLDVPQTGSDGGLVIFAPDVTPNGGTLGWDSTGEGSGSCTLTCHGVSHGPERYRGAP